MTDELDIQALFGEARAGRWPPVALLVGPERFLAERATKLLKRASVGDGPPGFNDDAFQGASATAQKIISAARTLPMMARARFVLVRDADSMKAEELEALAAYVAAPSPSTCVVMTAEKLDGRSKLAKAAKTAAAWYACEPLKGGMIARFVSGEAKRRGHVLQERAAAELVDAIGDDLAALDDAIERLSLFVGPGQPIGLEAVHEAISRIRVDSVWTMVDAIGARRTAVALGAVATLLQAREAPLKIVGLIARQLRMIAKMKHALSEGARGSDAAKIAGALPFKARDLEASARMFDDRMLAKAIRAIAETDIALKGSRRPPDVIVEELVLALCEGRDEPIVSPWQFRV